ncbi:hypothetical protein H5T52_11070 [Candidatus Bipolaricaulota bacterium]|nr:hypothetical protein [Candidatus Bipolaricaulota bacterium]
MGKVQEELEKLAQRVAALEEAVKKREASLKALDQRVTALDQKKPELPPHEHPQYAKTEELQKLATSIQGWAQKSTDLEKTVVSLRGETGSLQKEIKNLSTLASRVENLEKNYNALAQKINSSLPNWQRDVKDDLEYLQKTIRSLEEDVFLIKTQEEKNFEELKKCFKGLENRLVRVEALAHRHLGQPVKLKTGSSPLRSDPPTHPPVRTGSGPATFPWVRQ